MRTTCPDNFTEKKPQISKTSAALTLFKQLNEKLQSIV